MLHTQLIHGDSAFEALAGEWDALAGQGMTDTPFQSLAYQRSWWQHLGPAEGSLHTVVVRDEHSELKAIASFYLLEGSVYFNGCVEETDYLDLITPVETAETAWEAIFDCLVSSGFPNWSALDLCNVPAASPTREILLNIAEKRGFVYQEEIHEVCPIIELPATFDEYLSDLSRKQRHEVRRKLRRAQAAGATIKVIGPDDDLETAVGDFLELLQKSTLEKREWLNDGRRAVFHETAEAAQAAGTLQLMFAEVSGRKAAALFNFHYRDRIWVYNSGLDPATFGNLSLGVVITAKAIEAAIETGCHIFDFLRGGETYKYRFGAEDTEIYRIHVGRPS